MPGSLRAFGASRRSPAPRRARPANHTIALARDAAAELKAPLDEMPARLAQLIDERRKLERDLTDAKKSSQWAAARRPDGEANGVRMVGNVKLMARAFFGGRHQGSQKPRRRRQEGSSAPASSPWSASPRKARPAIVVGVTSDLTARFNAVDLVRKGAEALGGKGGGGRPDMAQAGGPDGAKADLALAAVATALGGC